MIKKYRSLVKNFFSVNKEFSCFSEKKNIYRISENRILTENQSLFGNCFETKNDSFLCKYIYIFTISDRVLK